MSDIASAILPSIVMTIGFTLLCGIAYPLVVTGVGQAVMPHQANGSLMVDGIRSLRKKLEQDPADPRLFVNEPGVGYRLATLR